MVYNLVTERSPHKGDALVRLLPYAKAKIALYVGDDHTDEDIFDLPDPRIATVRVGNRKSSRAKYYVRRQSDINALLRRLIKFHSHRNTGK